MKKIIYSIFVIMLLGISVLKVNATCNDQVLLDAKNVTVEAIPMTEGDIYYIIRISNLTPNVYVTVYEDDNETTTTYTYEDSNNGTLDIEHWYIYERVYYTVNVYSDIDGCQDESLNVLKTNTKKFNDRWRYSICVENPELEKCQPFYEAPVGEEQTDEEFYEEVQQQKYEESLSFWDKAWIIVKEYYLYVLIPIIIISVCYGIVIYVYKTKRSDVDGK